MPAEQGPPRINMKFRPCIDLHAGVVKQIVGGTLRDDDDDAGGDGGVVTNFEASKTADYFSRCVLSIIYASSS